MIDFNRYLPPTAFPWQGRPDSPSESCFFQIIKLHDLQSEMPVLPAKIQVFALLGFACDEGIRRNLGRRGADKGPTAIRTALATCSLPNKSMLCYDVGDITCEDGDLEASQQALSKAVNLLLQHNITPIVLGGGHELALGHYQGIAQTFQSSSLGIVNFDAHFDMRPLLPKQQGSSGTPFLQIAKAHEAAQRSLDYNCIGIQPASNIPLLFATAHHYQTHILLADEVQSSEKNTAFIERILQHNQMIYVSLCLDVFAAAYAPGVSAPQALGLTPWQVIPYLRQLAQSAKVISYDIAELSPVYDIDKRTAKLAAHFIYEIIQHHTREY
jgi:formiminoglutamase